MCLGWKAGRWKKESWCACVVGDVGELLLCVFLMLTGYLPSSAFFAPPQQRRPPLHFP
jgi:hypothetical protein